MNRTKSLLLLSILLVPAPAGAWDLIYSRTMQVSLCSQGCSVIFPGFALIANTGASDIGAAEFYAATFTTTSSDPKFEMTPFAHDPGPPIAPFHPGEVVGSVFPGTWGVDSVTTNAVLLDQILPGETFRNTVGLQFLPCAFTRTQVGDTSENFVHFQVRMVMGGEFVDFETNALLLYGNEAGVHFAESGRVSSRPLSTPAGPTTWGRIKSAFR